MAERSRGESASKQEVWDGERVRERETILKDCSRGPEPVFSN